VNNALHGLCLQYIKRKLFFTCGTLQKIVDNTGMLNKYIIMQQKNRKAKPIHFLIFSSLYKHSARNFQNFGAPWTPLSTLLRRP